MDSSHFSLAALKVSFAPIVLAMGQTMGAAETFKTAKKKGEESILSYTQGRGVDTVLDLVGKNETIHSSLALLKKGGKLVLVGYSFDKPFSIFPAVIMRGEFRIIGSQACGPAE